MLKPIRGARTAAWSIGLALLIVNGATTRCALGQAPTAAAGTSATEPAAAPTPAAAKTIDPNAACGEFVAAEVSGKPLSESALPPELQDYVRSWVDQLQVCKAFVAKNDDACMSLPSAERQKQCKAMAAQQREIWKNPPRKVARIMFAASIYANACRRIIGNAPPESSESDCRALERAVRDGDVSACAGISNDGLKQLCTPWATGDPRKCDPKFGELCTGTAAQIGKIAKNGMAAIQPPDEEARLLIEIASGKSKKSCDALVNIVKKDCAEKAKLALGAAAAGPTPGAPGEANPDWLRRPAWRPAAGPQGGTAGPTGSTPASGVPPPTGAMPAGTPATAPPPNQ